MISRYIFFNTISQLLNISILYFKAKFGKPFFVFDFTSPKIFQHPFKTITKLFSLFSEKKFKSYFTFISHQSLLISIQTKNSQQNSLPNTPKIFHKWSTVKGILRAKSSTKIWTDKLLYIYCFHASKGFNYIEKINKKINSLMLNISQFLMNKWSF